MDSTIDFRASKSLGRGIASLLNSDKYSDLTITTQKTSFKVHKAVICTQSKVLAAMSDAGFKETSTAILPLHHDSPEAIECMVTFLYTGDYDGSVIVSNDSHDEPVSLMERFRQDAIVYSLADKYDIPDLKLHARAKFEAKALGAKPSELRNNFHRVVEEVFDTTPDTDKDLRGVVIRFCVDRITVRNLLTLDAWTDLLAHNGAIALAMLKAVCGP